MKINKIYTKIADVAINKKLVSIYIIKQENNLLYIINENDLSNYNIEDIIEKGLYYKKLETMDEAREFIHIFFENIKKMYPISVCEECKEPYDIDWFEPYETNMPTCEKCFGKNNEDEDEPF